MTDPVHDAADGALSELLEVSPQVDAAVVLERGEGRLLASAPESSQRVAGRLATSCSRILDAAEQARTELGREPVAQVEVATPDGHVFVVADTNWVVAAVTDADPTVGLVFYDLKTALRSVREARAGANGSGKLQGALVTPTEPGAGGDGDGDGDAGIDATDPGQSHGRNA